MFYLTRVLIVSWLMSVTISGMRGTYAAEPLPLDTMQMQLLEWLYQTEGVDASEVTLTGLDRRVRVPVCSSAFTFAFPFNDRSTVRVSCPPLGWSIVTRVIFTPRAADQPVPERRASASEQAPVLYELLIPKRAGDIISINDLRVAEAPGQRVAAFRVPTQVQLVGARMARDLSAGSILQAADIQVAHRVLTVTSNLPRGSALSESNTEWLTFYGNLPTDAITSVNELRRMVAATQLRAGQPIRLSSLRQLADVMRGDQVVLAVRRGPVAIETQVVALEQGVIGEQIRVRSEESGEIFSVIITGVRRVEPAGNP
jgi:flagella basal body P-ring formation protein FlgA